MARQEKIATDLDGTIRQAHPLFDRRRDDSKSPFVRWGSGIMAALIAKRINPHIEAEIFVTGSPASEDKYTRVWMALHGLSGALYGNPAVSRYHDALKPSNDTSAAHKIGIIDQLGIEVYHEDNRIQGEQIIANTGAEVRYVI